MPEKLPLNKRQKVQRIIKYNINNREYDLSMNWVKKNYEVAQIKFYQSLKDNMYDLLTCEANGYLWMTAPF